MLQVDDLIEPGAKQILFTRLPSFPWPHVAPRKSFLSERITNQICKESPSAKQFPGKLDFHNAPFLDSKSRTWEFFTDDQLQTRFRDLAAQRARVLHLSLAPMEGVGNAGCPLHPRPRVHFVLVERTRATTSTPESPGIPARNGFTAYVALSPVTGLFCHRRQRICFV